MKHVDWEFPWRLEFERRWWRPALRQWGKAGVEDVAHEEAVFSSKKNILEVRCAVWYCDMPWGCYWLLPNLFRLV